jgi:hypothetical protein
MCAGAPTAGGISILLSLVLTEDTAVGRAARFGDDDVGLAIPNVWIHDKTDPCRIDDGICHRKRLTDFVAASDALLEDMPKTSRDVALEQLLMGLADTFKKNPLEGSGSTK